VNAVGGALMTGGSAAVQGISMLNPQRWAGGASEGAYSRNFDSEGGGILFEVDRETEIEEDNKTFVTSTSDSKYLLRWPLRFC